MFKNISWAQGFFRLWVVYGLIVVIITGVVIYVEKPPSSIVLYFGKSDSFKVIKEFTRDKDLFNELIKRELISPYKIAGDTLWFLKTIPENTRELKISNYRKEYQSSYNSRLWDERIRNFKIGLLVLITPLLIGLVLKWILGGFVRKESG